MPSNVGDICECCKSRQEKTGKPVRKLIALPPLRKGADLAVCKWCDAPVIAQAEATINRVD